MNDSLFSWEMAPKINAEANAERGANLLDEKYPGWYKKINLDNLDITSCFRCILGQLYGSYENGIDILSMHFYTSTHYGFTHGTPQWKELIQNRLDIDKLQEVANQPVVMEEVNQ